MSKLKPIILLLALCLLATEAFCAVDPLTGTYSNQATDLILRYQSIQLEITRSYDSVLSSAFPGRSRPWFFHPFDKEIFVFEDKGQVLLQDGSGIKDFRKSGSEPVYRSAGNEKILFKNGTYTLTLGTGIQEIFDGDGRLTGIRYPDGNSLSLLYNNDQLERITSNDTELLHFYYNSTGQVEQIKTFRGTTCYYSYNSAGLLTEAVDEYSLRTGYEYDAKKRLAGVHYQTGDSVKIKYHASGGIVQRAGGVEAQTTYQYKKDKAGNIIKTVATGPFGVETYSIKNNGKVLVRTDVAKNRTEQHINDAGLPVRLVDAGGHRVEYHYDSLNRLTQIINSDHSTIRFFYIDDTELVREQIFADGSSQQFDYNDKRQLIRVVGPGNAQVSYQYNEMGLMDTELHGAGKEKFYKKFTYNDTGELQEETDSLNRKIEYRRDSRGRIIEMIDPLGRSVKFQYDQFGNLAKTIRSGKTIFAGSYDQNLRLVQTRNEAGLTTRYGYNDGGKLASVTYNKGNREDFAYDKLGRLSTLSKSPDNVSSFQYNNLGLITKESYASQAATKFHYDPVGNMIEQIDSQGQVTEWTYDSMSRIKSIQHPGGIRQHYEYDRAGRMAAATDTEGNVRKYRYDNAGNFTGITLPNGDEIEYAYDRQGLGNLVSAHRMGGRPYRYGYDAGGRLIREETPWGQVKSYSYDGGDRLIKKTSQVKNDPEKKSGWQKVTNLFSTRKKSSKGSSVSYQYDPFDRLIGAKTSDGLTDSFDYDEQGNLIQIETKNFKKNLQYNRYGELVEEHYPLLNKRVKYTWDARGNRSSLEIPGHLKINYTYDPANRLIGIDYQQGNKIRIAYDNLGRKKKITYPNGVNIRPHYNKFQQLQRVDYLDRAGKRIKDFEYKYNRASKLESVSETGQIKQRYTYDQNGQLMQASSGGRETYYEYGASFQRTAATTSEERKTFKYNPAGQMISAGDTQISYDSDGNVAVKRSHGKETSYSFDAYGRLRTIKGPAGEITYDYSPDGMRVAKNIAGNKRYYVYDGNNLLMELDGSFEPFKFFIHAGEIDSPMVMLQDGHAFYYLTDYLGSVNALVGEDGRIATEYSYEPFGSFTQKGRQIENPFTFTARFYDPESGLYYYRARYYDPELGLFISPDPKEIDITQPQDLFPYLYAANDPINYTDPLGLWHGIDGLQFLKLRRLWVLVHNVYPGAPPVTAEMYRQAEKPLIAFIKQYYPKGLPAAPGTVDRFGNPTPFKRLWDALGRKPVVHPEYTIPRSRVVLPGTRYKVLPKGGLSSFAKPPPTTALQQLKNMGRSALNWAGAALIGGLVGYDVGSRHSEEAKREGKAVNYGMIVLETFIRAPLAAVSYGTSENVIRYGINFKKAQDAFGRYNTNRELLAAVQQKVKEKSDKEKKKGDEGQTRLEKWITKIEDNWLPRVKDLKENTGDEIDKINSYAEDMSQAAAQMKKYSATLKEDIDCKGCRKKVNDLVELSKTRSGVLEALMAQRKEARRLSRSICLDPKAQNAGNETKRAKQAADIARDLAKTLKETGVKAKPIQKEAIQCAQKAAAYDKILKTNRQAVVKERVATDQKLKKLLKDAQVPYNQIKSYLGECNKLKNSMKNVYEATRKQTDKTIEYLMEIEAACRDIDYALKGRAKESIDNVKKTYDAMMTQCMEVESEMDMKKPCNIPEVPPDFLEADFENLGDTAEMFAHQSLNYSNQALECLAAAGGLAPDKKPGSEQYFVVATGDSSDCNVGITGSVGFQSARSDTRPGEFADPLGGSFSTFKAAENACYAIAESRAFYIHSDQLPGGENVWPIVQLWYIEHRGQHCWISSCVPWEKRGELTEKRKQGTPPDETATAGTPKGPKPGAAGKGWNVYVKVIDAQGSGIEEASVTAFMNQLRATELGAGVYLLGPIKPSNLSPSYSTLDIKAEAFNRYGGGVLRMYKTKHKTIMLGKAPVAHATIQFDFSQGLKKDEPPPYIKLSGQSEDDKKKTSDDVPEYIKKSGTTVTSTGTQPKTRVVKPPVPAGPPKTGSGTGSPPKKPQPPKPKPKKRTDQAATGDSERKLTDKECEQKSCPGCDSLFGKGFSFDGSETACDKCFKDKAAAIDKCKRENQ